MLALAPDASSQKGAQGVSTPAKWPVMGVMPDVLWGECKGSGASPYHACVDLSEPAYRCDCPSRKFPCKHALGLLLLWAADAVPSAEGAPAWVTDWLDQRRVRAAKAAGRAAESSPDAGAPSGGPDDLDEGMSTGRSGGGAEDGAGARRPADDRRAAQREERVAGGLAELERWLADQIGQGIAGARQSAPAQWEELARRLVDAQAPGVASAVSRLHRVLAEEDWPSRLLGEYALLNLLAVGYRRAGALPVPLRETIRSRVGFLTSRDDVLAGPALRDHWQVLGQRDEEQDRLVSRRVWLRGRAAGRFALVLSFAPVGQALDASLVTGTTIDAELAFYPGTAPLRALVAVRHGGSPAGPPPADGVPAALAQVAAALEGDPWLESWPVVLGPVVPVRDGDRWLLADASPATVRTGDPEPSAVEGVPLHPAVGVPWRLLAVSGGHPVTVSAEWSPQGLRPLTTWDEEDRVVVL